jgi:hypothetical protein
MSDEKGIAIHDRRCGDYYVKNAGGGIATIHGGTPARSGVHVTASSLPHLVRALVQALGASQVRSVMHALTEEPKG